MKIWWSLLPLLALTGCAVDDGNKGKDGNNEEEEPVDSDGDGLFDDEEAEFGSDPAIADTDGDGLGDLEERDAGTDPNNADSDGDTYLDYDEIVEGTDPNDAESRIYVGYWPYNRDKDAIPASKSETAREGEMTPRFVALDQYGDEVDLYDFLQQEDRPVVLNLTAEW